MCSKREAFQTKSMSEMLTIFMSDVFFFPNYIQFCIKDYFIMIVANFKNKTMED